MAANKNATASNSGFNQCQHIFTKTVSNGGMILGFILAFILSNVVHHSLKPLSQPRLTSDIAIGLFLGNIPYIRDSFHEKWVVTLTNIAEFGMMCYMFVLGIEMDPYVLLKPPTRDAIVAYAGMLSTFTLACSITPFLYFSEKPNIGFTFTLSFTLSGSGSHILTRIITNLKIGKSDIGKLVINAGVHSDMISMLFLSVGYIFVAKENNDDVNARTKQMVKMTSALVIQTVFTAKISPIFMNWVNNENPEGRPMKGPHLVLSVAFMVLVCSCSPWFKYSPILSAFMAGIFLPSEGRVSKWAVGKINYLLTILYYPIFFFWVGYLADFRKFEGGNWLTWARFFVLLLITMGGKIVGTLICGVMLGFHWKESVELGLLLTPKAHFHIFMAILGIIENKSTSITTCIEIIIVFFLTVVHAPSVVKQIIKRARKRAPTRRMTLQWLDPTNELRILLCIQGPQNVSSTINFMEISRGAAEPGMLVYVSDIIELTDQIAATVVHDKGVDSIIVTDKEVTKTRDEITNTFQAYVDENGNGITLRRTLALSSLNSMAQDICVLAEDLMISLIILPFHKTQHPDGTLDGGHPGFRYVNRKVLRNAPCSVGILVDRGFGMIGKISRSQICLSVAVIFIGGRDDREALAYASRVARHPGVKLTVIRFLLDTNPENASRIAAGFRINIAEQELEMKLDDECFAEFYERQVAGGHVAYMEKHLANSAETYSTLRSLEGQYALIIVGLGGRVNSVLTVGMNDWQQCPELGPVGDVLSGPNFSVRTSVLIIQQHNQKGELDGLDDDFSVM
ncbi:putative monovalent cation:proton antiporter [Tripterygium wilfordii]|uniref:Putative monovalent cation:proton antiporter n=1 Tax=Tripterygium wilfordii TaxID=458696 RepID=A0A7J7CWC1_TRIWF|nr:putative monovalent cation:proton antiporter [Tripterygium wilfordii]